MGGGQISFGRTLVVAPHPDDEVLGAGGTIARLAAEGEEVFVAVVTEGKASCLRSGGNCPDTGRSEASAPRLGRDGNHMAPAAGSTACRNGACNRQCRIARARSPAVAANRLIALRRRHAHGPSVDLHVSAGRLPAAPGGIPKARSRLRDPVGDKLECALSVSGIRAKRLRRYQRASRGKAQGDGVVCFPGAPAAARALDPDPQGAGDLARGDRDAASGGSFRIGPARRLG